MVGYSEATVVDVPGTKIEMYFTVYLNFFSGKGGMLIGIYLSDILNEQLGLKLQYNVCLIILKQPH